VLEGDCHLRLTQYEAALDAFEQARAIDASLPRADLGLAVAHYHLGDLDAADRELDRAAMKLPRSAEVTLYKGLVLLAQSRTRDAVDYLERSRRLDAAAVEPVATYHLGLAHALAGDRAAARRELLAVIQGWPGTPWAEEARRALERLGDEGTAWWAAAEAGFEYDDNVVLRGDGVPLAEDISGKGDFRGVWALSGGARLFEVGSTRGGVNVAYDGGAHTDLSQFDYQYPAVGAWIDHQLNERTLIRGIADFGYAWVDGDPFLASWRTQFSAHHDWDGNGVTRVYGEFWVDNFFESSAPVADADPTTGECPVGQLVCGPAGVDERSERNRDGQGVAAGLDYSPPIPAPGWLGTWIKAPILVAGYRYAYFDARGSEYSYDAHEVHVSTEFGLPFGLSAQAFASFTYRPYRNPTTFPNPDDVPPALPALDSNGVPIVDADGNPVLTGSVYPLPGGHRREREWRVELSLSRTFFERYTLTGGWRYIDNQSSADVYDYDRHIIGITFQVTLGD
jgi:hypothetical protein